MSISVKDRASKMGFAERDGFGFTGFHPFPKIVSETLRPNGNGAFGNSWRVPVVDRYLNVDEVVRDNYATYIYSTTLPSATVDTYNIEEPTFDPAAVVSQIEIFAWLTCAAGTGYYIFLLYTGGALYDRNGFVNYPATNPWAGMPWTGVPAAWTLRSNVWTVNPQTGLAWTFADIQALQIGIALGRASQPTWQTYCTQIYVVIT